MYLVKRFFHILIVAFIAAPVSAYADSWSCSSGNSVREVHIERSTSAPVPCKVVYKKQTEGVEDQVLWNAENDEAYCAEKAKGLVATLESNGWVCTETIRDDGNIENDNQTSPGIEEGDKPDEGDIATDSSAE